MTIIEMLRKLKEKFISSSDIKSKAVRGSAALSIGAVFQRVLRLGRTMILTRLLVPEDFGLIAITMMVVEVVQSVTDAGIRISIIQNKEGDNPSYLNAAWWFQTIRGTGLFIVTFLAAPYIAAFYNNPLLADLIRVSSASILLNGLVNPRVHLLERELSFGKWTMLVQISALFGTIVTIGLGYYLRNAWAIVLGTVIELFIYSVISYVMFPFRPKLEVDKQSISELFKFARGIFGLAAFNLISRQADIFVLAKLVSPAILGSYYLALQLAEQPITFLSNVFPRVLLPVFAKMQGDKSNLQHTFLSLNRGIALLGIPIATFMAINSSDILSILYGDQYKNANIALSLLSINIFIRAQLMLQTQTFFGLGLPHLHRNYSLYRSLIIVGLMYPAVRFAGLGGASLILLLANTTMFVFQLNDLKGILSFKLPDLFGKWVKGLVFGVLVAIPNVFFTIFKIHSFMYQSILSVVIMITVFSFGFVKLIKEATSN